MTWSGAAFVFLVFTLAGTVKGVIGLGMPTVAMGLLTLTMPPVAAASLLVAPALVTNLWQMLAGARLLPLARRLLGLLAGMAAGTLAGSGLLAGGTWWAGAALGLALIAYGVMGLGRWQLQVPARAEPWAGPLAGAATGLIAGATGVFVLPLVPYLAALSLDRDGLVQALGLTFTVATLSLATGLAWHGALPWPALGVSALAIAPALLGMALGAALRARVAAETFRRCFFAGLLVLGAELTWHALSR